MNKKLHTICSLFLIFFVTHLITHLLSFTSFAGTRADRANSLYGFIGGGAGYGFIHSDLGGDGGDKEGFYWQAQSFLTYYTKYFESSFGLGYFETSLKPADQRFEVITETSFVELSFNYRLNHRFSVGPSYRQIIGEELLFAPSTQPNVNSSITTSNTLGVNLAYDVPINQKYMMKVELAAHKALDTNDRDAYLTFLQFSFGARLFQQAPPPTKVVYRDRVKIKKELVSKPKLIKEETIELSEQVLNFDTGKYEIKGKSLTTLEAIAQALVTKDKSWEFIKVIGHTDSVGDDKSNEVLSGKRAGAVAKVLIQNGVNPERIYTIGMGENRLKSLGKSNLDHQQNRRVEFSFIGKLDKDLALEIMRLRGI